MIDRLMCFGVDLSPMLSLALIARHYLRTSVQAQSEPSMRITIRRVRHASFTFKLGSVAMTASPLTGGSRPHALDLRARGSHRCDRGRVNLLEQFS